MKGKKEGKEEASTLTAYGGTSDVQVRDDKMKTEVTLAENQKGYPATSRHMPMHLHVSACRRSPFGLAIQLLLDMYQCTCMCRHAGALLQRQGNERPLSLRLLVYYLDLLAC
jgi:hypothetical protein